ncbi:hypothetical protein A3H53_02185 [Candidatus Nomurabacteria bacterium RIFCSPLOWO2_02_FULL_40_10]|uniref:Uncharacterized protein n=1 Tax=Candidatus Nomurabacteria bacterium RIFCSPLOWO2_02_FULL_40_10 TaxID=1801786 RepID=A0A1F6XWD2_9BACT|nr:MAG: hypothetical protein A3H53_02185 [Candidatus Nomurabacteria bacterium RIFCSPLOWO2_02_FULL_40_10]
MKKVIILAFVAGLIINTLIFIYTVDVSFYVEQNLGTKYTYSAGFPLKINSVVDTQVRNNISGTLSLLSGPSALAMFMADLLVWSAVIWLIMLGIKQLIGKKYPVIPPPTTNNQLKKDINFVQR